MLTAPPFYCRTMQIEDMADVLALDALSFPTPMKKSLLEYELVKNNLAHYQVLLQKNWGRFIYLKSETSRRLSLSTSSRQALSKAEAAPATTSTGSVSACRSFKQMKHTQKNLTAANAGDTKRERIVGFAGYWLMGDEVHISTIAVHPELRGKHLGELLLLNMMFLVYEHPASLVTLEVRHNNITAQQLYAKYDFAVVGKRPRYYKDTGEDAILMTITPLNGRYHQFLIAQKNTLLRLPPRLQTEA